MNKLALALAFSIAALGSPAHAAKKDAPTIKVVAATGEVKVVVNGQTTVYEPGETIPALPAGAQITVISGQATFTSGDTAITANAGDSFAVNTGRGGAIQVSGAAGAPVVTVGENSAVVKTGDAIAVGPVRGGAVKISVVSGSISVTTTQGTQDVSKGQSIAANVVPGDLRDAPNSNGGGRGGSANPPSGGFPSGGGSFGAGANGAGSNGGSAPNPAQEHQVVSQHHP